MKVIHLGVGGFGRRWSEVLQSMKNVEVVALVDIDSQAMETACELDGYDEAICYTSLAEALKKVNAEMLLCITPPKLHYEHISQAVDAGLHVLCEKPMATTLEDCVLILKAVQAGNRTAAISQQYRYHPEMQTLAELVSQGMIGQVGQIKLDFYKGWPFDITNFRRWMPYPTLVDMSIHHFDLLRFITGLEAVSVRGEAWNPPWSLNEGDTSAALTITMENGARVVYNASWCAQGDFCDWNGNWIIEGEKGSLVYEKGIITLNRTDSNYQITGTETIPPKKMALAGQHFLLADFIDAVKDDRQPPTSVADNMRSISLVFAAVEAVQSGRPVPAIKPEVDELLEG